MLKKIITGVSTFALATVLVSCSAGEELPEVDVNGLTISAACEKVREAGWRVSEVKGTENSTEKSDCTDSERNVVRSNFFNEKVTLYFANDPLPSSEEAPSEAPIVEEEILIEEPVVEEAPIEEAASVDSSSGYQAIYDEYSARIQNECPALSMSECAELSNEGVSKMAEYMFTARGTDGQYATYEMWSGKLMDVYMSSVQ